VPKKKSKLAFNWSKSTPIVATMECSMATMARWSPLENYK
jgi:hypothetical protein